MAERPRASPPRAALRRAALVLAVAAAATSVMTAALPAQSPDEAAMALLERTAAAYRSARTLRAEFTQTLTNPRTGNVLRSAGEFLQRGTQQFAFRFTEPAEDRIVADGEVLWLYLPSTAKGQVLKVPRAVGGGIDLAASVLRDVRTRYAVVPGADSTVNGRPVKALRLTPKSPDVPFSQGTLWVDPSSALILKALLVEPTGLRRELVFGSVRPGVAIPAGAFEFTPPEGVRVIDQAALMGGSAPPKKP